MVGVALTARVGHLLLLRFNGCGIISCPTGAKRHSGITGSRGLSPKTIWSLLAKVATEIQMRMGMGGCGDPSEGAGGSADRARIGAAVGEARVGKCNHTYSIGWIVTIVISPEMAADGADLVTV